MECKSNFWKSKIGRRFFLLFLFCAFLPTIILMMLSYQRVGAQLEEQSLLRLQKETKAHGLSLFGRLVRMETLLGLYGIKLSFPEGASTEITRDLETQMNSLFKTVYLFTESGKHVPIIGSLDEQQVINVASQYSYHRQKNQLVVQPSDDFISPVYMLVALDKKNARKGFLLAELNPSFLWGIGSESLLPAMTELAIYDDAGKQVMVTYAAPREKHLRESHRLQASNMRQFEYEIDGRTYLASSWSLFLQSKFDTPLWTIILSQSKKDILAPMTEFNRVFPLVILLSLWIVLLLSMYFLRKNLEPLTKLQKGTKRIANKDFTTQVVVNSGDEFEELAASFNAMTARLNTQFNALAVIDKIDRAILSSLDSSVIVPTALWMMRDFFHADVICFAQNKPGNTEVLELAVLEKGHQMTPDSEYVNVSTVEREILFGRDEYTLLESTEQLPRFLTPFVNRDNVFLSLPLFAERKLSGTVIMSLSVVDSENIKEEIKQARQIVDQFAIALTNAGLVQDLERLSRGTIEALARTVDAKSEWTAGHSERVAALSVKIGKVMGFNPEQIDLLNRGGLLHDIGKIGVPLAILDKSDKLNDDEMDAVRSHPLIGEKILEPVEVYNTILPIVVQHHERVDGKGYPHGLAGDEIDINARILAVADVYDALISQRPYRQGWVEEKVLNYIKEQTGKMFDPKVVDAFITIVS